MSASVYIHPHTPTVSTVCNDERPQLHVEVDHFAFVIINDPARAYELADAFLLAAQRLEAHLEQAAARAVNALHAERNALPFGSVPATPVQHITVTAPVVEGTDTNPADVQVAS